MSNDRHTMFFMGNEYPNYGGGGGGSFSSEKIYTNSGGNAPANIQLSKAITDFDAIILNGYRNNMTTYYSSNMYLTEEVVSGRIICLTDDSFYAWYTVTNDTTLTSAGANIVITDIYGIKFGGGSSGGGGGSSTSEIIELTAGDGTSSRTFTFEKTPKKVTIYWETASSGTVWTFYKSFIWGDRLVFHQATDRNIYESGWIGNGTLTYNGNSVTMTNNNALQACNNTTGFGHMLVEY